MLKNKMVLITGASSGIGEACAHVFAEQGAHLLLCARRIDRIKLLAEQLQEKHSIKINFFQLDVRDYSMIQQSFATLPIECQAVDILINNAGLSLALDKLQDGNVQDWDQMIDTNIKGLLYVTRLLLPSMVKRNQGHIINIGSISGHAVYSGGTVYCATKYAVRAITEGLQLDLLGTNIRVSRIDPGLLNTEFSTVRFAGNRTKADAVYRGMTPLAARDVAETVLFCATRPPHVNVSEIIVLPTDQRSATQVYRREE